MCSRIRVQAYRALLVCALIVVAGCSSAPKARETVRVRDLQTPAARQAQANQFWLRSNVPDLRGLGYKRIAIAEFVVEFVTEKRELTSDLTTSLKEPPAELKNASGTVQKIEVRYPNEFDFPAQLHKLVCDDLVQRGFEVLPSSAVSAAVAYRRYQTQPERAEVELTDAQASASDTGRIRRLSQRSLPGLAIIRGGGGEDVEIVDEALRKELGADVLLRIRIRVGTFAGHATLERGAVIHVVAPQVAGTITAERSLVSDDWVLAETKAVGGGFEGRVSLPGYQNALRAMFPPFIAMAFETADAAPKPASGNAGGRD